jgi:hypothetical protein
MKSSIFWNMTGLRRYIRDGRTLQDFINLQFKAKHEENVITFNLQPFIKWKRAHWTFLHS